MIETKTEIDLTRGIEAIFPSIESFRQALQGGKRLTIYHGADPTGPHLHLGHATNLLLLRRLQDLGHRVIFLVGDFTARIGDPSGKLSTRRPLTEKEIRQNFATFRKQVAKVIRFHGRNSARVVWNSRWLKHLRAADFLELMGKVTVQQMIERDMFQERLKQGAPIWLHEFLYPLLQGYDSVALNVDAEIGGNDQTFNMLMGRDLLKIYKNREKFVISTTLLVDPRTGKKLMNKSEGGLINLDDEPNIMYGKVMALPDEVIFSVAELCTLVPEGVIAEWRILHPRDAKMRVAQAIVALYHSESLAMRAEAEFVTTFQKGITPSEMPEIKATSGELLSAVLLRADSVASNGEFRRLISAGAIGEINSSVITDPHFVIQQPLQLKIGKHRFLRINL